MTHSRFNDPIAPMDLANMRENGVRSLWVVCPLCHQEAVVNVDSFGPDVPVPAFGPRMVCTACGIIGADVRPNWQERPARESITGKQNAWQHGEGWAHIESRSVRSCSIAVRVAGRNAMVSRDRHWSGSVSYAVPTDSSAMLWKPAWLGALSSRVLRDAVRRVARSASGIPSQSNSIEGHWHSSPKTCRELHHRHCQKPQWPPALRHR